MSERSPLMEVGLPMRRGNQPYRSGSSAREDLLQHLQLVIFNKANCIGHAADLVVGSGHHHGAPHACADTVVGQSCAASNQNQARKALGSVDIRSCSELCKQACRTPKNQGFRVGGFGNRNANLAIQHCPPSAAPEKDLSPSLLTLCIHETRKHPNPEIQNLTKVEGPEQTSLG